MGDIMPVKPDRPVVGRDLAGGHAEACRLAGAVGPEKTDDFAGFDLEVDAIDDLASSVVLHEAADLEHAP